MAASPARNAAARKAVKPKVAPKAQATPAAKPAAKAAKGKGEALLRAGLKALGEARERQSRVVETLLGIPSAGASTSRPAAKTALDSLGDTLGFRKLEDVFDQRIAAALERLGMPTADEFAALREEVRQLRAERTARAAAPASRRKR